MQGDDFHTFYSTFYHAKQLAQYVINMIADSCFNLHSLHLKSRQQGDREQRVDHKKKFLAAQSMIHSMKQKIKECGDLLVEYQLFLESDMEDCERILNGKDLDLIKEELDMMAPHLKP